MRKLGWAACLVLALAIAGGVLADDEPIRIDMQEEAETRLVQVDVSVRAKGSHADASVPGLTLDHFEIRLDGRILDKKERSRVVLDTVCKNAGAAAKAVEEGLQDPLFEHGVILVVDLNYVGARGRHRIATMLDELASRGEDLDSSYKVYALTRQVHMLTDGFTKDATDLRVAAAAIRQAFYRREFVENEEDAVPSSEGQELSETVEENLPFDLFVNNSSFFSELRYSELSNEVESDYRPSTSLAGIEAIMRANLARRGRKELILFSSEAFRFVREDLLERETREILEMGRRGFTIWTVDVEGVGQQRSGASELLSMLAQETGGDSVRNTGDFQHAIERVEEQLSCYYLFSLPVKVMPGKTESHTLEVRIDTKKHPEMWGWTVRAPTRITIPGKQEQLSDRRLAALLAPDDFLDPPVTATLGLAPGATSRSLLVNVRAPLDRLAWIPSFGAYHARVLVDAVVVRDKNRGTEVVCETSTDEMGILEVELPKPPLPGSRAGLAIEVPCEVKVDGIYTARGVLTDIESGKTGAGRSTLVVRSKGTKRWQVHQPRVRAVSGKDFVYNHGSMHAKRDRQRRAWRMINDHCPAGVEDRIAAEYLLCGPKRSAAKETIRHTLRRLGPGGQWSAPTQIPEKDVTLAGKAAADEPKEGFCARASITFPENTLPPGTYSIEILAEDRSLGAVSFEILQ